MEAFLGSIMMFGFGFAPRGWAYCNGATLNIAQNSALYALLGTTYGGNGTTTFALPNLTGRTPIGGESDGYYSGNFGEINELKLSKGTDATVATLKVNYCIALQGIFPSRN